MRKYFRVFLGSGGEHIEKSVRDGFIGVHYGFKESLGPYLAETWSESRELIKPAYMKYNPNKSPVGAGLSCGALWTVAQGMQRGDVLICPDGNGNYFSAEVSGDYKYVASDELPHQRPVTWRTLTFPRASMSEELRKASKATLAVIDVSSFATEIEALTGGANLPTIVSRDESVEDPSAFVMEQHLEEFLVFNWNQTELSKQYDLVKDDEGEVVARQYQCDTGRIDILAVNKNGKEYLVIELKKGRPSDEVVGQILRYMGFVKKELATNGENVRGIIIALESDLRMENALSMVPNIDFYRYKVDFQLIGK
jgi:restriction system protein